MKIKKLLLPFIPIVIIGMPSLASADSFSYRYPLSGVISQSANEGVNDVEDENNPSSCYDPANINTIGTEAPCTGMLIFDNEMLRDAVDARLYAAHYEKEMYRFDDSERNIFTGQVTDMSGLFKSLTTFTADINYWDTSNVTDMSEMFTNMEFNAYIGDWDTSKVTNMSGMFRANKHFNQDISKWNTENVTDFFEMFAFSESFNQDLSSWCVELVDTAPTRFDASSTNTWTLSKPNWGTCP